MFLLSRVIAIFLSYIFVQCSEDSRHKDIFSNESSDELLDESLMVVSWTNYEEGIVANCDYYSSQDEINQILQSSNQLPYNISEDEMLSILEECSDINDDYENPVPQFGPSNAGKKKPTITPISSITGYEETPVIFFPGTKWCGAGTRAKDYDDLGIRQDADRCCRAHDFCDDWMAPGETRNNLTNDSKFTKFSCKCDHDFYNCLDQANDVTSNTIGNMYFNFLKNDCYALDYPTTNKCKKYKIPLFKLKCIEYEKNTKGKKVYQWFQAKSYKKIPPISGLLTMTVPF